MPKHKYIAIAGNIGAGKSSLVQFLATQYQIKPFYEPNEENPYLADFYQDMKRWAFHSQLFFLTHKFGIHKELEDTRGLVVLDRTIYEDAEIFAAAHYQSQNISQRDFEVYWDLYQNICKTLRPPDLMIYLKCSVKSLQKRIASRGRQMEKGLPAAYLRQLQTLYDAWIANYPHGEVITIETDKLDYITDLVDRIDVMKRIEQFL
jgi:deoxyadenosine/deoxycytidine kinase